MHAVLKRRVPAHGTAMDDQTLLLVRVGPPD